MDSVFYRAREGTIEYPGSGAGPDAAPSYVVKSKDTVNGIARRFAVSPQTIIDRNRLQPPYALQPGQTLAVPGARVIEPSSGSPAPMETAAAAPSPPASVKRETLAAPDVMQRVHRVPSAGVGVDRHEEADLAQGLVQVHGLDAEDRRPRLRRLQQCLQRGLEVVEHVVQDVVDPDHVERLRRQVRLRQRSAEETRLVGDAVDRGALPGQIDRPRRDVEPGDARAQLGQDHRVLPLAAADVEDGFSAQIAEELEAALLGVGPAGIAVALEDRFLHGLEPADVLVRPAIEELRFLRQLRRMSHF